MSESSTTSKVALGAAALALLLARNSQSTNTVTQLPAAGLGSRVLVPSAEILIGNASGLSGNPTFSLATILTNHTVVSALAAGVADLRYQAVSVGGTFIREYAVGAIGFLRTINASTSDGVTFTKDNTAFTSAVSRFAITGGLTIDSDSTVSATWSISPANGPYLTFDYTSGFGQPLVNSGTIQQRTGRVGGQFYNPLAIAQSFAFQWPTRFTTAPLGTPTITTIASSSVDLASLVLGAIDAGGGLIQVNQNVIGSGFWYGTVAVSSM